MKTNTLINTSTRLGFFAAMAAAAFLLNPLPASAKDNAPTLQTCAGTKDEGGQHCTLTSSVVTSDGILHCLYDCYVVPKNAAAAAEMAAIGAGAVKAYEGLNRKDPASVKKVNAALQKAHEERAAYAKAHDITLKTKEHTHKMETSAVEKKAEEKK